MDDIYSKKPEECAYSFTQHRACEFFPCHKTNHPEDFNCLFCYCPLYTLGSKCGGNFKYLENGVKDCSDCLLPHGRGSYSYIISKYPELMELAKRIDNDEKTAPKARFFIARFLPRCRGERPCPPEQRVSAVIPSQ